MADLERLNFINLILFGFVISDYFPLTVFREPDQVCPFGEVALTEKQRKRNAPYLFGGEGYTKIKGKVQGKNKNICFGI